MKKEVWKPVVDAPDFYEVSNLGRVRSVDRWVPNKWGTLTFRKGIIRKQAWVAWYLSVSLSYRGKRIEKATHIMVLEAFVGPRPFVKAEGCHNDGDRRNNKLTNLRWATRKENAQDTMRHRSLKYGEENGNSKLTENQVVHIRKKLAKGTPKRALATQYGVTWENIAMIEKGLTWKSVG